MCPQSTAQSTTIIQKLNQGFAAIADWSLQHRWWVLSLALSLLFISLYLSQSVRMNNSFDAYFNDADPAYTAYLQYREDFGSDEIAFILYDASNYEYGVFNRELMQKIKALTYELEQALPFVDEVKSLANIEIMTGDEDGLNILLIEEEWPLDQTQLLALGEKILSKPMYVNAYVSENRRFGAIRLDMQKSSIDPVDEIRLDPEGGDGLENVYPQVTETAMAEVLGRDSYQGIDFYVSGDVPLNAAFNRIAMNDMTYTALLSLGVIALLLLYFFKGSLIGLLGPLSIVLLSIVITLGFLGLVNWDMDMMFAMVPTLLLSIGIAQAIHIISEFRLFHAELGDRSEAIKATLSLIGAPCLLTSLTTAAGFMALSISPIKTISHMAVYTSLAVMAAFFLSITLLSFFLSFGKQQDLSTIKAKAHQPLIHHTLLAIANFTIKFPKLIVAVSALLFIMAGFGISQLKVDSNFLLDFKKHEPIRQTTEYIDETMGGMGSLLYLFDSEQADGIKNPKVLKEIEAFQSFINTHYPLVQKTYSIVDLLKDINQSFNGGAPAFYTLPEDEALIAQYLLVYEMSGGKELHQFISPDYARANIEVRTQLVNSSDIAVLKQSFDAYLAKHPLQESKQAFSGIGALWIQLIDYISISQLQGVLLAFVVISILMCFIFRSVKIGLISMIPNIAPAILTVGLIGWLGFYLDYMKLLIAPIAIGIAVDDTIHMMTRLQHAFAVHKNYAKAIREAMTSIGRALLMTSIILICGFSSYTLAQMDSQMWFGILLALTIFIALIADFFLMPALVLLFKPFGEESAEGLLESEQAGKRV